MSDPGIIKIDINKLKKKVAEKLGLSITELNTEIEKIKAETDGIAGDRTALLILMERWGIRDKDLIEEIVLGDSIVSIQELSKGSKIATVLARIMRILPDKKSRNENIYGRVLIEDHSGKAILYLFGKSLADFKKLEFDIGDLILIKRARVGNKIGEYLTIIADDDTVLEIPDEKRFINIINQLPDPPLVLSLYEFIESMEIFGEGDEVNVRGVVESKGELREFERKDGQKGMVINLILGDENVPMKNLRVVVWGDLAKYVNEKVKPGQVIDIYGARIKSGFDQFGNSRLELHLGKLSTIKVVGEKRVEVREISVHKDEKVVVYGVVSSNPIIREFEREGVTKNYVVLRISDNTGTIRVVVWEIEGDNEKFENLKVGDLIRVYGRVVVDEENRAELHCQRSRNLTILPSDHPIGFDKNEILERIMGQQEAVESRFFDNFKQIPTEGFVGIRGRVAMIDMPEDERLPCQLLIEDAGGNTIKVIGWERELFNKIYSFGMGAKVSISNLRVDRDKVTEELILKATRRTEIEKISEEKLEEDAFAEFTDARTLLDRRKVDEVSYLRDADFSLGSSKFIASIILINRRGKKNFCLSCGAPILEGQDICENGHVGTGKERVYVDVILDDGVKSYEAIISSSAVGIEEEKAFLEYVEEIIGLDMVFEADPKIRKDGSIYLIVKKIESLDLEASLNKLIKKVKEKVSEF